MKVEEIFEQLNDEELKQRAQAMKKAAQDKMRQARSFDKPRRRGSRLTGRGRGTGAADQSMVQK